MRLVREIVAFGLFVFIAGAALAASERDHDDCHKSTDKARRLTSCTRIIQDQKESTESRARTYISRAKLHAEVGDLELVVFDYGETIRLTPNDPAARYGRGNSNPIVERGRFVPEQRRPVKDIFLV